MMTFTDIQQNKGLINLIDWEMTPEEAVRIYLEWSCSYTQDNYVARCKESISHYFAVNTWGKEPMIYLIRRSAEKAMEIASFPIPASLKESFLGEVGRQKGIFALTPNLREWLQSIFVTPAVARAS